MKYTKEERLDIGRRIYQGEMTMATAATTYGINIYTARDYLRLYKASENVSIPSGYRSGGNQFDTMVTKPDISQYEQMSREELIDELIRAKVEAERAKKGYEVKGDGQQKEFVPINNKNSK
jgi:transposase